MSERPSTTDRMPAYAWRSVELGPATEIALGQGPLRFHECGQGRPIIFVHGWLANANLWRKVVPRLAGRWRCIAPDLPLGAHLAPMHADFDGTPDGIARLINEFLDALGIDAATLVGNDSGGAYSQIATAARPARIERLILNACETPYDSFPPAQFKALQDAARTPDTLAALLAPLRDPTVRHSPAAFGRLIKHPIDSAASDSYALPILEMEGVCRDASRVFASASQADVAAAGRRLISGFGGAVHFIWPTEDVFFSLENVQRYASELQRATVDVVNDAFAFTPEDQPARFAELLGAALASGAP